MWYSWAVVAESRVWDSPLGFLQFEYGCFHCIILIAVFPYNFKRSRLYFEKHQLSYHGVWAPFHWNLPVNIFIYVYVSKKQPIPGTSNDLYLKNLLFLCSVEAFYTSLSTSLLALALIQIDYNPFLNWHSLLGNTGDAWYARAQVWFAWTATKSSRRRNRELKRDLGKIWAKNSTPFSTAFRGRWIF